MGVRKEEGETDLDSITSILANHSLSFVASATAWRKTDGKFGVTKT